MSYYLHPALIAAPAVILFGCETMENGTQSSEKQALTAQRERIVYFAANGHCSGGGECRFIGLGSKPCGGPWEYLVYSTSVDTVQLKVMIGNYNAAEDEYNKKWGILSDCSVPPPPDSLVCVNGKCAVFDSGNR